MSNLSESGFDLSTIENLTHEEREEAAAAYLQLIGHMMDALEQCDHGYGFFWWNGRAIETTGHMPEPLLRYVKEQIQ